MQHLLCGMRNNRKSNNLVNFSVTTCFRRFRLPKLFIQKKNEKKLERSFGCIIYGIVAVCATLKLGPRCVCYSRSVNCNIFSPRVYVFPSCRVLALLVCARSKNSFVCSVQNIYRLEMLFPISFRFVHDVFSLLFLSAAALLLSCCLLFFTSHIEHTS